MKRPSASFRSPRCARSASVICVALIVGHAGSLAAKGTEPQPTGALHIGSAPSAATVWLDGSYFGPTPLLIDAIPTGRHLITLTKAGFTTQEFSCEVAADKVGFAARSLAETTPSKPRRTGRIVVHGHFDPVSLRIDGAPPNNVAEPAGRAGLTDGEFSLVTGSHTVRAVVDGLLVERRFTVVAETRTVVALDIRADAAPDRTTRVVAPVDGRLPTAQVTIDGPKLIVRNGKHSAVGRFGDPVMRVDGEIVRADPAPMRAGRHVYLSTDIFERLGRP